MSKKISQLTAITASNTLNTSVLPMSQGSETYKIDINNLRTVFSPTSSIRFTATDTVSQVGKLHWDGEGLSVGMIGDQVSLQIGREELVRVRNVDEDGTLASGEVVYLFGATGQLPSVKRASNLYDTTSSKVIGMVTETISTNGQGFVTTHGIVNGVDTGGFNEGDILWLSSSSGQVTNVKPTAPENLVFIGVVVKANQGNGSIYVNPQNGYELNELHDVESYDPNSLKNGYNLSWDESIGIWKTQPSGIKQVSEQTGTDFYTDYGIHEVILLNGVQNVYLDEPIIGKVYTFKGVCDACIDDTLLNATIGKIDADSNPLPVGYLDTISIIWDGNNWWKI